MTIFRFSLGLVAAATIAGCNVRTDGKTPPTVQPSAEIKPPYQVKIKRNGEAVEAGALLRAYSDNPNRLALDNKGKSFEVTAKIAKIPEFDKELDRVSGFYLPLQVSDDPSSDARLFERISARAKGWPQVGSVSVFVKDFSQEKAAKLSKGQLVKTKCAMLRIVQDGLVFDDCELEMG